MNQPVLDAIAEERARRRAQFHIPDESDEVTAIRAEMRALQARTVEL
eukprot:SAG11_NODE_11579_length_751_cov_0.858896_1_plen_46_part_10